MQDNEAINVLLWKQKPVMREKIREVMRFSGPRMIYSHPITAIRHVIETKKEKKRLEKKHEN